MGRPESDKAFAEMIMRLLRHIRLMKEIPSASMAEMLGINPESYNHVERYRTVLSIDRMNKICEILGVSPYKLVKEVEIIVKEGSLPKEVMEEVCEGLIKNQTYVKNHN